MSPTRLVRMANQIAASVPDQSAAARQAADHIRAFWTPAMITDLSRDAAADPQALDISARAALDLLLQEDSP